MSFKVGEKVVCVNDTWSRNDGYWNYPELNQIYTIEFVMYDGAVTLEEIDNSHIDKEIHARGQNDLAAFFPRHFKKVDQIQEEKLIERALEVVNF